MNRPATLVSKNFANVTEPRADRGQNHDLLEMNFLALTATICGANGWGDAERFANAKISWFRKEQIKGVEQIKEIRPECRVVKG